MKELSSTRIRAACAAVALLALWSMVNFYGITAGAVSPEADVYRIGDQTARFKDLIAALPRVAVVGYVTDAPPGPGQTLGSALYGGAQFAFAPRLVTDQMKPSLEWVVGDFSKPLDVVAFGKERGLTLVKDFGNGAVLYRNQAR